MHELLNEINELYLQIQAQFDPLSVDYFRNLAEDDLHKYLSERNKYHEIYEIALEKFRSSAPLLSPNEIIEGYQHGSRLLQRNLSGYMVENFSSEYIPVMLNAIEKDEPHTAYIYIATLTNHLGKELKPILWKALHSEYDQTRQSALSAVFKLKLKDALPLIRKMVSDPNPEISEVAKRIAEAWQ